jgi:hypothetical protein
VQWRSWRLLRRLVWAEARKRISEVKMVSCILMTVVLVWLGVLVLVEKIQVRCTALNI